MRCVQVLSALALRRLLSRSCQPVAAGEAPPQGDFPALSGYHLTRALRQANARAWLAAEVVLAGEDLWERAQVDWRRDLDAEFFQPLRALLDATSAEPLGGAEPRRQARQLLESAARSGLLTTGPLDPAELWGPPPGDADEADDPCWG